MGAPAARALPGVPAMKRTRASGRSTEPGRDAADRDDAPAEPPSDGSGDEITGSRLTVSYQRWCAALRDDDLLFVECLLADVRRLLEAGGTFVVVGLSRSSLVIRDLHQVRIFAAQIQALHRPRA